MVCVTTENDSCQDITGIARFSRDNLTLIGPEKPQTYRLHGLEVLVVRTEQGSGSCSQKEKQFFQDQKSFGPPLPSHSLPQFLNASKNLYRCMKNAFG